jgi:hypothetical protein
VHADLGGGRCLAALGRADEGRQRLVSVREAAERIEAHVITREADELLAMLGDVPV